MLPGPDIRLKRAKVRNPEDIPAWLALILNGDTVKAMSPIVRLPVPAARSTQAGYEPVNIRLRFQKR